MLGWDKPRHLAQTQIIYSISYHHVTHNSMQEMVQLRSRFSMCDSKLKQRMCVSVDNVDSVLYMAKVPPGPAWLRVVAVPLLEA